MATTGESEQAVPVFSDVSTEANSWSYSAIAAVSRQSIFTGFEDGSFRPGEILTRAQMAVILERLDKSSWNGFDIASNGTI
jgi:hypothetical protein